MGDTAMSAGSLTFVVLILLAFVATASSSAISCIPTPAQTPNFSRVEVITFDFYAALMDTVSSLQDNAIPILANDKRAANMSRAQTDEFVKSWAKQYSGYVGVVNALQRNVDLDWADKDLFKNMLHITLDYTCASQDLPLSAETRDALVETWKNLRPYRNTVRTLQTLRAAVAPSGAPRFRLATLSNADQTFLRAGCTVLEREMGFKFDAYLGCDGLGNAGVCLFKPEPAFYNQTRRLVEGAADDWKYRVLHVAGAAYDANGAKAFGQQHAAMFL